MILDKKYLLSQTEEKFQPKVNRPHVETVYVTVFLQTCSPTCRLFPGFVGKFKAENV